jgi:squalene-hopene/tetraprenyl-beta-curcumene cyclase
MFDFMIERFFSGFWPKRSPKLKPEDWAKNLRPAHPETIKSSPAPQELGGAVRKAQAALLRMQNHDDGYWCAPLKADTTISSDTIMLLNFLGRGDSPKIPLIANHILSEQLPDGGWPIFKNGPADVSATIKAYWALKFAGHSPSEPRLVSARKKIRELGGIHKANTYMKFYMALFGQYSWEGVPTIPPELMLFPEWFYFNIYEMSAWTRAIVVPLSIVWATQPGIKCPPHAVLDELFPDSRRHIPLHESVEPHHWLSWTKFFLLWDKGLKGMEGRGGHWIRLWALRLAEDWMLKRLENSDSLGAIYPGLINTIMAMKCLGYSDSDPRLQEQLDILERLELPREGAIEYQPCHSPIWDTAIAVTALAESGLRRDDPALVNAAQWMVSKEIMTSSDWKIGNPAGPTGGWHFQFRNPFYPDIDDSAMVMLALRHVHLEEPLALAREKACLRGIRWLWSMQSSLGGWAAFDKENVKVILTKIPFADHNAMIDPPTADVTGRVLELMGYIGYDAQHPGVAKALRFLREEQEDDGSWFGRWGVNYIYGTWQVLRGLSAIGEDGQRPYIAKAARWLKSVQHENGGWGETCATYNDPSLKGRGPSTPSQTAWAVMGLLAAGCPPEDESVRAGIDYLLSTQKEDGTWDENEYTGTGFPKVFYLEYTLYRQYFPIQALGNFMTALNETRAQGY